MDENPALAAVAASGLDHVVLRHGQVRSLAEAADARGVEPADVVKTMVDPETSSPSRTLER